MTIKQIAFEFGKDSPIAGLAAATFMGVTLDQWVLITGLIYGVARLVWLGVEAYWKWKDRRNGTGK